MGKLQFPEMTNEQTMWLVENLEPAALLLHTTPSGVEIWDKDPNGSERPEGAEVWCCARDQRKFWCKTIDQVLWDYWPDEDPAHWLPCKKPRVYDYDIDEQEIFDYLQSRQEGDEFINLYEKLEETPEVPPSEDAVKWWANGKYYRVDEASDTLWGYELSNTKGWTRSMKGLGRLLPISSLGQLVEACKAKAAEVSGRPEPEDEIDIAAMAAEHKKWNAAACEVLKKCIVNLEFNKAIANMSPQELIDRVLSKAPTRPGDYTLRPDGRWFAKLKPLNIRRVDAPERSDRPVLCDVVDDEDLPSEPDAYKERGWALIKKQNMQAVGEHLKAQKDGTRVADAISNAFTKQDSTKPMIGGWGE